MPGTYRYSATFDRTYEESEANSVRFSIQSWQGSSREDLEEREERNGSHVRSPSTDSLASGSSGGSGGHSRQVSGEGQELSVPGSSGKQMTSPIHNPLQFIKVGPINLCRKAEEQIKIMKEVKHQRSAINEDEEWQQNLDKWKSRRKKVSEKTIQRVEERRQIESAVESQSTSQRKIKTFSEMLEERSHKPRSYNLAIYRDDSESGENKTNGHSTKSFDDDDLQQSAKMINGDHDDDDTGVGDSGLESFGSSQRTYDIPDSSSEISGGSLDRLGADDDTSNEGITTGVDLLREFSSPTSVSSRELSEELQPEGTADLKSLERFFKNGLENDKASEKEVNGDSVARDSDSKNEKSKKTPPPIPTKPKLLRMLSAKKEDASVVSVLVDSVPISKPVEAISNSRPQTKATSPLPKESVAEHSPPCNETIVDFEAPLIRFDDSDSGAETVERVAVCQSLAALEQLIAGDPSERNTVAALSSNELQRHEDLLTPTEDDSSGSDGNFNANDFQRNEKSTMDVPHVKNPSCTQYVEVTPEILGNDDSDTVVVEEQIVKVDAKAETKSNSSHLSAFDPVVRDDGLTVIYQSHPPSTVKCTEEVKERCSSVDKSVLNNIIDELETAIKCEMESEEYSGALPAQREPVKEKKEDNLYDLTLELYTDEQLLAPPSQVEPPKERPPPPPPPQSVDLSSSSSSEAFNGVQRMSTFKRIKKELWRRRSDFLGIDPSEESVDVDATVPPPPDLQEMLKSQRDVERQWMERNRPPLVPEDEIVRREREIIENLEREERERQDVEKDEQELMLDHRSKEKKEDEERIRRLKDERRRMEEERFQREEQRMRLEEERLLREREEQMRKQEDCTVASDESGTFLPVLLDSPPKEVLRLERERLQQEREAFLREKEEYNRRMEEQKRAESQKASNGNIVLGREAVLCASKHPQGFNANSENHRPPADTYAQEKSVKVEPAPPPVILRNRLQSLGAPPKAKHLGIQEQQLDKASKRRSDPTLSRYNQNHWLIQEAEMRRLAEQSERQQRVPPPPKPEPQWNYRTTAPIPWRDPRKSEMVSSTATAQDHFLSVSGKEKCSHCGQHLGRGEAMIIESLQLCYHLQCFRCCVCQAPLGNGSCGTDVRVRNNKLHCQNCYSNDEAGLKFSQV